MDERELVCLNDGRGTRINVSTGKESVSDITLVSNTLAGNSNWEVWTSTTVGSDHYPVFCSIGQRLEVGPEEIIPKWKLGKADWDKFKKLSDDYMIRVEVSGSIDEVNNQITTAIIMAAEEAIPKGRNRGNRKLVPWWNEECYQAVRDRNKAFRLLKRTHTMNQLIQYKKAQAVVRRTIRQAKKTSWRNFCDEIGRTTPVGEVWSMIKRMGETGGSGITQLCHMKR